MFYSTVYVKIMSRYFAKTAVIVSHIGLSEVICSPLNKCPVTAAFDQTIL
ncbi:hypothetical protein BANRA_05522 [Klebsiella pneumoniae]|nr:hypothetical protein BANRA_05522 [Klebsiella pneumoniae]